MIERLWTLLALLWFDLRYDRWRTLLTVFNLVVILLGFFLMSSASESLYTFGSRPADDRLLLLIAKGQLDIVSSDLDDPLLEAPLSLGPGVVEAVSPMIVYQLRVGDISLQVRGIQLENNAKFHQLRLVQGTWMGGQNVVLTREALRISKKNIGDSLHLYGQDFTISGEAELPADKLAIVWMTIEQAEQLFETQGHYQIGLVRLSENADFDAARLAIEALPAFNNKLGAYAVNETYRRYGDVMGSLLKESVVLMLLSLLMVTFGTYNAVHLNLSERSRELALLLAAGFSIRQLRQILTARMLLQTLFAGLLAWTAAVPILMWYETATPVFIHGLPMPLHISAANLFLGLGLSLVFSWLGLYLPTRQFAREAIAQRGKE